MYQFMHWTEAKKIARRARYQGEGSCSAKLTNADVVAIRADPRPYARIARDYGVVVSTVCKIRTRRTWRHV